MFKSDKQRKKKQPGGGGGDKLPSKDGASGSSLSSIGGGGGAFVVKRPAHLRSAAIKKESKGSPSVERLASPIRLLPHPNLQVPLNSQSSNSAAANFPQLPRSHTLVAVFPSLDEFVKEREVLRGVLADLQQFFCELDLDLECCTLFETPGDILQCIDQYLLLTEILSTGNSSALVFIGDRYGEELLPLELSTSEYNAIREAALELADDAGTLLDQFYQLNRGTDPPAFQLMAQRDPAGASRLCAGIKKCVPRAFEDGTVGQLDMANAGAAKRHFTKSFIEMCVNAAAGNKQSLVITRRFLGMPGVSSGGGAEQRWTEPVGSEAHERLNAFKNELSARLNADRQVAFLLDVKGTEPGAWGRSKEAAGYEKELAAKLTEKAKALVLGAHAQQQQQQTAAAGEAEEQQQQQPSGRQFHLPSQDYQMEIVQAEEAMHQAHLSSRMPRVWVPRDRLDAQLASIVQRLLQANQQQLPLPLPSPAAAAAAIAAADSPSKSGSGGGSGGGLYIQMHGPPGSGKTAALCHLHRMLVEKGGAGAAGGAEMGPAVIIRFASLTDGSVFGNELFRNVFLEICLRTQAPAECFDAFLGSFHLSSVLAAAKAFLDRPGGGTTRPIVLLLDDVHLLKFGRTLGRMEHNLRKLFPGLSIVCTSNSAQPMLGFPHGPELVEVKPPSVDQALTILTGPKPAAAAAATDGGGGREAAAAAPQRNIVRFSADQLGLLRTMLQEAVDLNLTVGAMQRDEILTGQLNADRDHAHRSSSSCGGGSSSASIDARLTKAEARCGADNVRLFCEFLCCNPQGLTALELLDAFRLRNYTAGFMFEPPDILSATPLLVLRHLNSLLDSNIVDGRRVYFFRSAQFAQAAQHRYLQSAGDVKLANETLAKIFMGGPSGNEPAGTTTTAEESNGVAMVFPRPLAKEGGLGVDIRRVRLHWHFLLRAGDMEALKRETLCSFTFLEAAFRSLGLARLLSIFEECLQQILDNDLLYILEGILLPSIPTLVREPRQFVSEFLNRLRYTRAKNSEHLNRIVEQAMQWTDSFDSTSLLVPLTCWIPPPKMKQVLSFVLPQWKASRSTILQPTYNHQHLLVAGNELAPSCIYMFHIASQLLVRTFTAPNQSQVTSLCASKCKVDRGGDVAAAHHQPQNHFFTSTTTDGKIQIWTFSQTDQLKTLEASQSRILCSILSGDDKWIVVGSADSCARILQLDSGRTMKTFKEHTGPVVGLQLSSDDALLVTGSGDFAVMVWDIERGEIILRLQGLMAPVTCLALTSNDAFLAVACEDETLRVFSLVSAQELHELMGHEARVNSLQASADDCKLFAGTKGKVLVYDIHNGQLLEVLPFPLERQPITSVRISDDDSFILASAGDRVSIWAMNSIDRDVAAAVQKEQQHQHQELTAQMSQGIDGSNNKSPLASLTAEQQQQEQRKLEQQIASTSVSVVEITADEKGAACGTMDGILAFWDLDVCQCMWTSNQQRTGTVTAIAFSLDSCLLISGSHHGSVSLWETNSGHLLKQLQLHAEPVAALCVFMDAMRVLSCDSADNAYLWSLASIEEGNRKVELIASIANMCPPVYVRLSDTVIIAQHAANPKEMNIWSLSGDRLFTRSKVHHNEPIVCYAVNRSGTVLITGSKDLSLKLWQMDTGGLLIQVLVGHEAVPSCCCVSEDALVAVSGAADRQLIVWDVQTGSMQRSLKRPAEPQFMHISLDGSVFCSSGRDGWIEAWHTRSGRLLSAFNTHRQIEQLIMGADGDRILFKLASTAQLPIICLHNTPATLSTSSASRYERVVLHSGGGGSPGGGTMMLAGIGTAAADGGGNDEGPLGDVKEKEPVTSRVGENSDHQQQPSNSNARSAQNGPENGPGPAQTPTNAGGPEKKNSAVGDQQPTTSPITNTGDGSSLSAAAGQQQQKGTGRARRSKLCSLL